MTSKVESLDAREIAIRELNSLRGRLCTVIESVGLPHQQERSIITLIKTVSWQSQNTIERLIQDLDSEKKQFTVINNRLEL
jgi:hypothetical protein